MKIAVATCSIGGYDNLQGAPKQVCDAAEVDFFYYTDDNLPFPLTNLNSRYKARYLKSQMHRYLPNYDLLVWIDGRVKIEGNNFVQSFIEQAEGYDMVAYKHQQRKSVYEELLFIESEVIKGSKYLVERYADQPLMKELLFYKHCGIPEDYPLFQGGFFARWNNEKVNKAMDEWWVRLTEFSNSDQSMLSLVCWQHDIKINAQVWDEARTYKLFTLGKHKAALKAEEKEKDVND